MRHIQVKKIHLNDRRKTYWAKLDKGSLEIALEQLGLPKELSGNVKGKIDKINKKTMLEMIYKKLNMTTGSKNYSKNIQIFNKHVNFI